MPADEMTQRPQRKQQKKQQKKGAPKLEPTTAASPRKRGRPARVDETKSSSRRRSDMTAAPPKARRQSAARQATKPLSDGSMLAANGASHDSAIGPTQDDTMPVESLSTSPTTTVAISAKYGEEVTASASSTTAAASKESSAAPRPEMLPMDSQAAAGSEDGSTVPTPPKVKRKSKKQREREAAEIAEAKRIAEQEAFEAPIREQTNGYYEGLRVYNTNLAKIKNTTKMLAVCGGCHSSTPPLLPATAKGADQLVACNGGCNRAFHATCWPVGADGARASAGGKGTSESKGRKTGGGPGRSRKAGGIGKGENGARVCQECTTGVYACFLCGSNEGDVRACNVDKCNRRYHVECVSKFTLAKIEYDGSFECPAHMCGSCFAPVKPADATFCALCPIVYHTGGCVPPGVHYHNNTTIDCTRHPVRSVDVELEAEAKSGSKKKGSKKKAKGKADPSKKGGVVVDSDRCKMCFQGGNLMCCDGCPNAFHIDCLEDCAAAAAKAGEESDDSKWYCPDCQAGKRVLIGDIVWAKYAAYRWWPALVLGLDDVPAATVARGHAPGEFPVYFYGEHNIGFVGHDRALPWEDRHERSMATTEKNGLKGRFGIALREAAVAYECWQEHQRLVDVARNANQPMPSFDRVTLNKYLVRKPALLEDAPACNCPPEDPCGPGSNCLNRMLSIECDPRVCVHGDACLNQRIRKRQFKKVKPFPTADGRGWGLESGDSINPGDLVVEYTGEVIDTTMARERIRKGQGSSFYMMSINGHSDLLIDARLKGSFGRFINHSCEPNCAARTWQVDRRRRVAIVALRHISPGEELTYDYAASYLDDGPKQECRCGVDSCSGFIGGAKRKQPAVSVASGGAVAKKKRRKVKNTVPREEAECFVCKDGGELICCSLKKCPKVYHIECLSLDQPPKGNWICPHHKCDICHQWATKPCSGCLSAFCWRHVGDNLTSGLCGDCVEFQEQQSDTFRPESPAAITGTGSDSTNSPVRSEEPIVISENPIAVDPAK